MKKKIIIKVSIILVVVLLLAITRVPIFNVAEKSNNLFKKVLKNTKSDVVCVLDYQLTTGTGWVVVDSNKQELIGKSVALSCIFDPRFLKDNKEFDLDYKAEYIVEGEQKTKIEIDNELVMVLSADKITIMYDSSKKNYYITDLSFSGFIKGTLGMFNKSYRISK